MYCWYCVRFSHTADTAWICRLQELDFSGLSGIYLQPLLCDMSRALPLAGPGPHTLSLRLSGSSVRDSDLLPLVCCPRSPDPGSPKVTPSPTVDAATRRPDPQPEAGSLAVPPSGSTCSVTWGPADWSHPDCCRLVSQHLAAGLDTKEVQPSGVGVVAESNPSTNGEGLPGYANAQAWRNGRTSGKYGGHGGNLAEDTLVFRYGAVLYSQGGAGDVYWRTPREWGGALRLAELSLRECNGVTPRFLRELGACPGVLQGLSRLDLRNMRALQELANGVPASLGALTAIAGAAGASLKVRNQGGLEAGGIKPRELVPCTLLLEGSKPSGVAGEVLSSNHRPKNRS